MSGVAAQEPFDACGPLPRGTTVLEASAGTGKTWTIAALTTRWVAEGRADLSQVMLVTFGNAASRELRDRVRERMVSAERGLRDAAAARTSGDRVLALLADGGDEAVAQRRERLVRALAGFDEATIATTHSFCSQVLRGLGTAADTDPAATFTDSVDDLVREVVADVHLRRWGRPGAPPPPVSHEQLLDLGRAAVGSDRQARLEPHADGVAGLRRELAQQVRDEVDARKRRLGLVDHDDSLSLLCDALLDPEQGELACARVRAGYRVVLVDEFQDTDPVQWDVLRLAFHGSVDLVLVGDPKQAVYAFRGGDVTTYLAARSEATATTWLGRNWRSDPGLLDGLGHLLGGAALGDPQIVVRPVAAAHTGSRLHDAGAPVRLRRLGRRGHGPEVKGLPKVDRVRDAVAADVAAEVVALLSGPGRLSPRDGDRPRAVRPGDVAVLVRTNRQGAVVREALSRAGVPSVLAGGGSVFGTAGARGWLVLLEAMEQPHRSGRVRAAALSVFVGESEAGLDAAGDDLADALAGRLRRWAELLAGRGVAAAFEVVSSEERLPERVLGTEGGERLLTDLRHVAQSLHAAALAESMGLTALVEWLRRRIAGAAVETGDDRSRRLESDAAAVQVMTVHVSKGLEFPIVFVPFAWDRWSPDDPAFLRLHDGAGARVLDVGGREAPGRREALAAALAEESGEDLRLLYVALTRAQCQVVAHWAPTRNTASAPLHRLLLGAEGPGREPRDRVLVPADEQVAVRLEELAAGSGGTVVAETVLPAGPVRWQPEPAATVPLAARTATRHLDTDWRRTSYSALSAGAHAAGPGPGGHRGVLDAVGSEPEVDLKDDERDAAAASLPVPGSGEAAAAGLPSPFEGLPGGTAFGTLVHEVLEVPDLDGLEQRCAAAVARQGSRVDAGRLAQALRPVLLTPLAGLGVPLSGFGPGDRLAELSFELPLAGGDQPVRAATLRDVAALLAAHDLGPLADYPALLDGLEPQVLRGFLTGSIDAVLRLPGPAYAVVDHKTNRLGPGPLTTSDYGQDALVEEMLRSHYVLQALLYSVALHRYLRWRQPGYDPGRHLGPVLYLFLRGMAGPATPEGCGVLAWQPPAGLVPALSDLLAGAP